MTADDQPDLERIDLFLELAAALRAAKAVPSVVKTSMTISIKDSKSDPEIVIRGPDADDTLAFFARLRDFDNPKSRVFVAAFFNVLEAGASPRRGEVVAWLRRAYVDLGREPYDRSTHVLGAEATPRDVWELWTYGFMLHSDEAKRALWASLGELRQGTAKFVAYGYAADLFHLVTVVEAMLRDPDLDDRGVRMRVLTFDRRLRGEGPAPEFAKVDLAEGSQGA